MYLTYNYCTDFIFKVISFTLGVHFNIKYICHFILAIGWNNQDNETLPFDKIVLILINVSTFQPYF